MVLYADVGMPCLYKLNVAQKLFACGDVATHKTAIILTLTIGVTRYKSKINVYLTCRHKHEFSIQPESMQNQHKLSPFPQ